MVHDAAQAQLAVVDALMAVNRGGEVHTFTEVDEYGRGIVPELSQRMESTTVASECSGRRNRSDPLLTRCHWRTISAE
jgi:hypothetical protein